MVAGHQVSVFFQTDFLHSSEDFIPFIAETPCTMPLKRILSILIVSWLLISCQSDKSGKRNDRIKERIENNADRDTYKNGPGDDKIPEKRVNDGYKYEDDVNKSPSYNYPDHNATAEPPEGNSQLERYKAVKNLLVFDTKDTMKLDTSYIATLALGKNISLEDLTEKIKKIKQPGGKIKVTDTTLEIGVQMKARLDDKAPEKDPNFSIKMVGTGSDIRTYDPKKNKMVWQWTVTPLKEGYHDLALSISMIDKAGIASDPETKWYSITIFSEKKKNAPGNGFGTFLGKNWQWLISAIIIPLFIAWFTTYRRRKNEQQQTPPEKRLYTGNFKRKKK
jgi:hypothetical protein